ncbi:MAG TPA: MFS transporter [Terriglobales bacterium]|nr:MFS transporter [Terriglobales bacterium]
MSSGPARMLSAQLLVLLLAGALGMAALSLALPVLPLTVAATTHDPASSGLVTGVTAAFTIVLELLSPGLLHRFRVRPLLLAAMLVQLIAMAGFAGIRTLPAMLVCGALTGAGFGLVVTATVAAVGALVPPGRAGEAIGYFGLCASVPTILGPPLALLLLDARGAGAVFLAGAVTCAAGAISVVLQPAAPPAPAASPTGAAGAGGAGVLAAVGSRGVPRVWLAFACTTLTYGAAVSFTPVVLGTSGPGSAPVFLFVFGVTRMLARVAAGRAVDRIGERPLVLPSLAAGAVALALLQVHAAPAAVVSAACYGAAFGVVQTGAFVGMLRWAGPGRSAGVSGIWNMAVDAGIGGGALAMGPVGAAVGFSRAFWLLPALFALAFVLRLTGAGDV